MVITTNRLTKAFRSVIRYLNSGWGNIWNWSHEYWICVCREKNDSLEIKLELLRSTLFLYFMLRIASLIEPFLVFISNINLKSCIVSCCSVYSLEAFAAFLPDQSSSL